MNCRNVWYALYFSYMTITLGTKKWNRKHSMQKDKNLKCYRIEIYKSPLQFSDLCAALKHLTTWWRHWEIQWVVNIRATDFGKRICTSKILKRERPLWNVWHIELKKRSRTDFFWGRRLRYTTKRGTHTYFKQCDNLGLSLRSCFGCFSGNPTGNLLLYDMAIVKGLY